MYYFNTIDNYINLFNSLYILCFNSRLFCSLTFDYKIDLTLILTFIYRNSINIESTHIINITTI